MGSQQSVPNTPEDTPRSLLSVPSFKKAAPPLPPPTHRGNHPLQPTEARRLSTAHAVPRENPRAPCSSMDAHTVTGMCACSQYQSRFLKVIRSLGTLGQGALSAFLDPASTLADTKASGPRRVSQQPSAQPVAPRSRVPRDNPAPSPCCIPPDSGRSHLASQSSPDTGMRPERSAQACRSREFQASLVVGVLRGA